MTPVEITKETWYKLVEAVHAEKNAKAPIWTCITGYYSVCLQSLISPLSSTLYNLYRRLDGTSNETFESLKSIPAIYLKACDIIRAEENRIERVRAQQQQQTQSQVRR